VKDNRVYLRHILECLDAIRTYTADERDLPPLRAVVESMLADQDRDAGRA